MFLAWSDSSKLPLAEKIGAARAAYLARFGVAATVILLHPSLLSHLEPLEGVAVRGESYVQPSLIYVGQDAAGTV